MRLIMAALLVVSGCATSSGVSKMARDTYNVTASASLARGGLGGAKRNAYDEANQACQKQEREVLVMNERITRPGFFDGMHSVDLTFRCLTKDDPELARAPTYEDRPDVVIKDQRR